MAVKINASGMHYKDVNEAVRKAAEKDVIVENALGHRYIGDGVTDKNIEILGTPGNGLGAYLNKCTIIVRGNAQDATGDTMNQGEITVYGCVGDACGYGMRDGRIFVKGDAGYRAGIHMKEYQEHIPRIIIGGRTGSFLGEYQAGGRIIVLGLGFEGRQCVGGYCGTGMHGGKIFLRTDMMPIALPAQVCCVDAAPSDLDEIRADVCDYAEKFGVDAEAILASHFYMLTPNSANPYTQLYVNH
ncbi:MAG: glutamate synthase [Ruminococcus sp.]|jgi:glutamate synthase domain-containing protein 3|nr:glutamate synthase [Ruminococcus sp.]